MTFLSGRSANGGFKQLNRSPEREPALKLGASGAKHLQVAMASALLVLRRADDLPPGANEIAGEAVTRNASHSLPNRLVPEESVSLLLSMRWGTFRPTAEGRPDDGA